MKGWVAVVVNKWVVQFLGLCAIAVLIWLLGPDLPVGSRHPLDSGLARGIFIAAMIVLWVIYRLLMQLRAERKDRRLAAELAGETPDRAAEREATAEEVETLRKGFEAALKILQESRAKDRKGQPCLHELPWYAIIGAPGSGKTTALLNSGLKFPLAEQMGNKPVKGVSGTRDCDWWFTDEAVLLDTAGRYTTQDSHRAVDAAAWQGFLELLKKYRPRRPLNGVLVTLSLSDLLQQTEEERGRHARELRRRIQDLYQRLGIRLPLYMIFTKGDLVAGFTDFFADFKQEEREQVWGETFPADDPEHPQDWLEHFGTAYDELLRRLNQRTYQRIQEERDVRRRSLILDFPQQMALLRPSLLDFLHGVFAANRYEQPVLLRGIYFTSGTQEGHPIDRLVGVLASTFRLDRGAGPLFSGRGKSFFLTKLLREVIFPEAELAGIDPRIERRWKLAHYGVLGGALALTLGIVGLWTLSYEVNKGAIARTEQQIALYRQADRVPTDSRGNFAMLRPKLDALLTVREIWQEAGWLAHFGLYQGDQLDEGAKAAYDKLLREYFQPALVSRLEERLQAQPDILALKAYLMLGEPERLEPGVVEAVVKADWGRVFSTEPETLGRLAVHLRNLLELEPHQATRLNENLKAGARAALRFTSQEQQCYESFKGSHGSDPAHDFKLAEALQPNGQSTFATLDGGGIDKLAVPALFTEWGYREWFLGKSLMAARDCMEHNWVLGIPASASDPQEIERLADKLKTLYIGEYQRRWSGILAGIKLRPAENLGQTVDRLDVLSRPDSPLRLLFNAVEKNTSLTKVSAAAAEALDLAAARTNLKPDERTRALVDAARATAGFGAANGDPVAWMENYFKPFNDWVRGTPNQPVPLEATLGKAKELRDYFMQNGGGAAAQHSAAARIDGGGVDVPAQARQEFARLPEPAGGWLQSLTAVGVSQTLSGARGELKEKLSAAGIGGASSPCQKAFGGGRYPFAPGSRNDAPLADFGRFFGANGVMDQFFQANLKDFVDTGTSPWRQKSANGESLGLSPEAVHQFQIAAKVRDAYFPQGGQTPQVQFDLRPLDLAPGAEVFRFNSEGQEIVYRRGAEQAGRIHWPGPAGGSGVALTFETADGRQASYRKDGPWALFRLLDESSLRRAGLDRFEATFRAEGFSARFELRALSINNPLNLPEIRGFHCPESL